ncbi:MAG: CPBP family intramembrane glutamic endopeptidase [Tepidiformaceae bacterium]
MSGGAIGRPGSSTIATRGAFRIEGGVLRLPWGPRAVAIGFVLAAATFVLSLFTIRVLADAAGHAASIGGAEDIFAAGRMVVAYGDERLRGAAAGTQLPAHPAVLGDALTARIAYAVALLQAALFVGVAAVAVRRSPLALLRRLGLGRPDAVALWRPALATLCLYGGVVAYAALVRALSIDALRADDAVPRAVANDGAALALFALVSLGLAPFAEEVLFRGVVFGGLAAWGFWPAATVSAVLFAGAHLDAATFVPFVVIGLTLCWLFWLQGSLWESIACHFLFNFTSFLVFLGGR